MPTFHDAVEHEQWRKHLTFDKLFLGLMFPALMAAVGMALLYGLAQNLKEKRCLLCPHWKNEHDGRCLAIWGSPNDSSKKSCTCRRYVGG